MNPIREIVRTILVLLVLLLALFFGLLQSGVIDAEYPGDESITEGTQTDESVGESNTTDTTGGGLSVDCETAHGADLAACDDTPPTDGPQ